MPNFYAYMRVSTQTQAENNSVQMQENEIAKFVKKEGIVLSDTFSDVGISGTKFDRPGLLDLLLTLEKGDKVIVQNTSRLWREDTVKVLIHRELKKIGADIVSIEQPKYTIYETDPNNYLFNAIMEAFDQYDRMAIAMKLAKGRKATARKGRKPCGVCPIGYRWNGNEVEVDETRRDVVDFIFQYAIESNGCISAIERKLKEMNFYSNNGKVFSRTAIKNILTNDFYIGIVTYAGKKTEGDHEPIIDKETFDKVQEILGGR